MNDIVKVWLTDGTVKVVTKKQFLTLSVRGFVRAYEVITVEDITINSYED